MGPTAERNGHDDPGHPQHQLSTFNAHLVAASGEFVGTFFFLYFGYAGNMMAILQSPYPAVNGGLASTTDIWIAISYGFSLLVNVWAFYRISGGLFNPAVNNTSTLL
jgi:aquaporin related protein